VLLAGGALLRKKQKKPEFVVNCIVNLSAYPTFGIFFLPMLTIYFA
jgi:hypothetical protein